MRPGYGSRLALPWRLDGINVVDVITPPATGMQGVILTVPDHGGGLPLIERVVREVGLPGLYQRQAGRRSDLQAALQITLSGAGCVWPDDRHQGPGAAVPRGRCLLFRGGQPLIYAAVGPARSPWDFVYANLSGEAALVMVDDLVMRFGHVPLIDPEHPAVRRCVDLAAGDGVRHRRLDSASAARLACDLLLAVAEANRVVVGGRDLLDEALGFLTANLAGSVDIAAAARHCGVTREHLTRLFRRRLGLAPATWLRRERLRHAELLLRSGTLPVAVIARRVGFATASHFVQAFRRATGVTPANFRG